MRRPLWVVSGHPRSFAQCPLYPQKADITVRREHVRLAPEADIRLSLTKLQSGAAPTGGPPVGRCIKLIVVNAPIQEPAAAKAT
jgi:hypothetical protein